MLDFDKIYRRALIIGACMMGGMFALAGVVELIQNNVISVPKTEVISGDQADFVFYVVLVVSIAFFFVIRFLKLYFLQDNIMFLPDREEHQESKIRSVLVLNLMIVAVMTYAFCEVPALFGFVLFFLTGGKVTYFYLLGLVSLCFFIFYFPRRSQWETWLREQAKTSRPDQRRQEK
jgi:hypothetical protein